MGHSNGFGIKRTDGRGGNPFLSQSAVVLWAQNTLIIRLGDRAHLERAEAILAEIGAEWDLARAWETLEGGR